MEGNVLYNEKELFSQIARGDVSAYTIIFDNYFDRLRWRALKLLKSEFWAEEIVQDVFMTLWNNRENLIDIDTPSSYLFTMTSNRCFDRIRRQKLEIEMQYVVSCTAW